MHVKSIENQKQMQYLNKTKDQGFISNEEYSKKISKLTPHFSNQSNKNQ